jgi:hypothetical protein
MEGGKYTKLGLLSGLTTKKKSESDEKKEEERWFCTHTQNEYPLFNSLNILLTA